MRPEQPPSLEPGDARYWDRRDLDVELSRVFSVCHSCRMCVGYCPAFPELFRRIDAHEQAGHGETEALTAQDCEAVNDLCYQCKLCYFKCPYTPDDGHAFVLDFPRLMLRHKAQRARARGVRFQDRVLGEPQLLGRLSSGPQARLANLVNENRLLRKIQQRATGISAEFNLPPFAPVSFRRWFARRAGSLAGSSGATRGRTALATANGEERVALFVTCTTDYNMPSTGIAAAQVLEHNGFEVSFPGSQTCCGMPNLDGGDVDSALTKARRNVDALYPLVARVIPVVVPGPTCSYVRKKELPRLLGTAEAQQVSEHTWDLMEFLRLRWRDKTLSREFAAPLGRVGYHAACHLRAQKIGAPARILLSKVPGTEVDPIEECSAVDGTWGMKAQYYELGRRYCRKLTQGMRAGQYDVISSDCPLSGQRLAGELGVDVWHPVELLNRAYGLPPCGPASKG